MDNVAGEDVAELSCHVDIVVALLALGDEVPPIVERIHQFHFQSLQHVLQPILVESVGAGFALGAPRLVVFRKNEALSNDLLEHKVGIRSFVDE